jgi:hypothetical protein
MMHAFSQLFRCLPRPPRACAAGLRDAFANTRGMLDAWNGNTPADVNWLISYERRLKGLAKAVNMRRRCLQSHLGTVPSPRNDRHTLEQLIERVLDARNYLEDYGVFILRLKAIETAVNIAAEMARERAYGRAFRTLRRLAQPVPFEHSTYWQRLTSLEESTARLRSLLGQLAGCDLARVFAVPTLRSHGGSSGP